MTDTQDIAKLVERLRGGVPVNDPNGQGAREDTEAADRIMAEAADALTRMDEAQERTATYKAAAAEREADYNEMHDRAEAAERERDELKAEVERLRTLAMAGVRSGQVEAGRAGDVEQQDDQPDSADRP